MRTNRTLKRPGKKTQFQHSYTPIENPDKLKTET